MTSYKKFLQSCEPYDLMVNAPGLDPNFRFRVDGDAQKAAALINGFLKIADRLTINGAADASYRLKVNGDSYLNGCGSVDILFLFSLYRWLQPVEVVGQAE